MSFIRNNAKSLVALLCVQVLIGYEWLSSGIAKVASGDFPAGLADNLRDEAKDAPAFYHTFLNSTILPHGEVFGWMIQGGELVIGLGLILGAVGLITRRSIRLSLWATLLGALGAMFLALNFHLASGANHPPLIPADGFDETIDLDSLVFMMQAVLVGFAATVLVKTRGNKEVTLSESL